MPGHPRHRTGITSTIDGNVPGASNPTDPSYRTEGPIASDLRRPLPPVLGEVISAAGPRSSRRQVGTTLQELRKDFGLFSFQANVPTPQLSVADGLLGELGIRRGGIVECLVAKQGAGALICALQIVLRSPGARGVWAVVDSAREFYVPALSGWGVDPCRILVLRPATIRETCWAIEQCLRSPGVSATLAWVDERVASQVHRRWQLASEVGEGVGWFFRPVRARREPVWADLRLLVSPRTEGQGETRRIRIEVLYRRGGLGGVARTWEINHAEGLVCLVPQVANPTIAKRAARA
jgi:hypothetical protein